MKIKGGYVDGFVFPVTKKNVKAYTKMAKEASMVWKKFGALAYYECMGEDLAVKDMGPEWPKQRSFVDLAKAGSAETVWFSFIVYKNKAHRTAVNKKVMAYFEKKICKRKHADAV